MQHKEGNLSVSNKNSTMTLVERYNAISRLSIKYLPGLSLQTGKSKIEIANKLNLLDPMFDIDFDKTTEKDAIKKHIENITKNNNDRMELLANLVVFKYYRQWTSEDIFQQEACLKRIEEITNENPSLELSLIDLMIFVRNNGYFVQKKLPHNLNYLLDHHFGTNNNSAAAVAFNNCLRKICKEESLLERIIQFLRENVLDFHAGLEWNQTRPDIFS